MDLFAYYCQFCNLLFWLRESVVHQLADLHFDEALHGNIIRCPCCRQYVSIERRELEDVSSEDVPSRGISS